MKSADAAEWGDLGAPQREGTLRGRQAVGRPMKGGSPRVWGVAGRRLTPPSRGVLKSISEVLFGSAREEEVS